MRHGRAMAAQGAKRASARSSFGALRTPHLSTSPDLAYLRGKFRNVQEGRMEDKKHRIYAISMASVYPLYIAKAEKKGRTKAEVDEIIRWLTGHSQKTLDSELAKRTNLEDFFAQAPQMNPSRSLITGVVCGVRVQDIQEPMMREIRYLDKLIDELAKGKAMEKILRQ
jgi:hypothetical protein